ncbi:hypothetical protein ACFX2G_047289 [Malus domestica]
MVHLDGTNVDFVGISYTGAATSDQYCNYALGVLDKATQILKIVPIVSNKVIALDCSFFVGLISSGYQVGHQLSERYTMERPRLTDHLDAIKFICKDFWSELFKWKPNLWQRRDRDRERRSGKRKEKAKDVWKWSGKQKQKEKKKEQRESKSKKRKERKWEIMP